jgi:nitroimidazol reductase NimA-like FMN-containing flavoprotein (pyridoxamine 5'-phosphate oxidase superfamily)
MPVDPAIESHIEGAALSAHLATSVDDRPHVAPVWYGYRDGTLYTLTGGKKLANVRRNPRVAVSIENASDDGGVEWGVTLLGRATVVDDVDRIAEANRWVYDAYDGHETDGGGEDAEVDPDVPGEPGVDYALLEIDVGSATLQRYE